MDRTDPASVDAAARAIENHPEDLTTGLCAACRTYSASHADHLAAVALEAAAGLLVVPPAEPDVDHLAAVDEAITATVHVASEAEECRAVVRAVLAHQPTPTPTEALSLDAAVEQAASAWDEEARRAGVENWRDLSSGILLHIAVPYLAAAKVLTAPALADSSDTEALLQQVRLATFQDAENDVWRLGGDSPAYRHLRSVVVAAERRLAVLRGDRATTPTREDDDR